MTPSINAICVNYIYMYSNMINGILIYCNKRWKLFMFFANLIYKYLYTIIGLTYNILQISFADCGLHKISIIVSPRKRCSKLTEY
jgi:hypothetical protein